MKSEVKSTCCYCGVGCGVIIETEANLVVGFSAAKFALAGLSQALAQELRPHNIFVTNIVAGMINSDLAPLNPDESLRRRLLTPDDVAQAIVWVCTLPPSMRVDELPVMPRLVDL